MTNLALNKPATQSSISQWSKSCITEEDAKGANNGDVSSDYGFHTERQRGPWWQVDLEGEFYIRRVVIFNRKVEAQRLRYFSVLGSLDGAHWKRFFSKVDGAVFGAADDRPYVAEIDGDQAARFIRIRLDGYEYLHFAECQIFGDLIHPAARQQIMEEETRTEVAENQSDRTKELLRLMSAPFPEVFVINLDERSDRWSAIEGLCAACDLHPERVSAVKAVPGWRGCGLSHIACLKLAKERDLPWVLILEDDASFTPDGIARFRGLLDYLWDDRPTWQRFNGGPTFPADPVVSLMRREPPLLFARGFATHFNLIHAGAYDAILQWDPDRDHMIDVFYMTLETQSTFRTIATVPHIAVQTGSDSDITGGVERSFASLFRFSEQKLRECVTR